MKRTATAKWQGGLKDGKGQINSQSGAFKDQPYNFRMRFEDESGKSGTNPEELIAAAHAGCFSMALSAQLEKAGHTAENIQTQCTITMEPDDKGPRVKSSTLKLQANVPGMEKDAFMKAANDAKENCPISRLLNCEITLDAELQ
ncbi:OsmC family protein [Cesiribacter sp. SM1]|uniref:OsmC family protein n=1 Tax=Cesiribacter sp. SM1 TaxID=2861196 RepID=UPI001CD2C073|nr:OsmC family protein [Cesiribacter sp. SM1]